MGRVKANSEVSQAVLKAMAAGKAGAPAISTKEWADIKKVALTQLRKAGNPKYEFKKIAKSFDDMNKVMADKYADRTEKFVDGELKDTMKDRQSDVDSGPSVRGWSGYSTYRSGS